MTIDTFFVWSKNLTAVLLDASPKYVCTKFQYFRQVRTKVSIAFSLIPLNLIVGHKWLLKKMLRIWIHEDNWAAKGVASGTWAIQPPLHNGDLEEEKEDHSTNIDLKRRHTDSEKYRPRRTLSSSRCYMCWNSQEGNKSQTAGVKVLC